MSDHKTNSNEDVSKTVGFIIAIIVILIIIMFIDPWYTISETQFVVITRFGQPVTAIRDAGLHWKIPMIDKVNILPIQILEWDGESRQFPTYDKRMILIFTTVKNGK